MIVPAYDDARIAKSIGEDIEALDLPLQTKFLEATRADRKKFELGQKRIGKWFRCSTLYDDDYFSRAGEE